MKCVKCGSDLKKGAKFCSNCGSSQGNASATPVRAPSPAKEIYRSDTTRPFWTPDWRWHAKTLGIILGCLVVLYFVLTTFLSRVPKPYRMRDVPPELTPWLKK